MLKVYTDFLYYGLTLPIKLENKFVKVNNLTKADIIFLQIGQIEKVQDNCNKLKLLGYDQNRQYICFLELFHIEEFFWQQLMYNNYLNAYKYYLNSDKICVVHHNLKHNSKNIIFYDFIFNRQKLYMTDYDSINDLDKMCWTYGSSKNAFSLTKLTPNKIQGKQGLIVKYLCANRIYKSQCLDFRRLQLLPVRSRYRSLLKNFLSGVDDKPTADNLSLGYLGDVMEGVELESEEDIKLTDMPYNGGGTWKPIANWYYNSSYWSTYVETITFDSDKVGTVSEKTFDPLIKGHFILPFGYAGLIKDIQNYGFKLPTWIDYTFDDIEEDDIRFIHFLKSLNSLLKYNVKKLDYFYKKDFDIILHNREVFFTKKYDSLYEKLQSWIRLHET